FACGLFKNFDHSFHYVLAGQVVSGGHAPEPENMPARFRTVSARPATLSPSGIDYYQLPGFRIRLLSQRLRQGVVRRTSSVHLVQDPLAQRQVRVVLGVDHAHPYAGVAHCPTDGERVTRYRRTAGTARVI